MTILQNQSCDKTQKIKVEKKSHLRETKHLLTDADGSTNTRNPASKAKFAKKQTFFVRQFYTIYKQKFSNLRPLLSITFPQEFQKSKKFGHLTSGSWGKKTFKWSEQMKKNQ